tara:strand:- start:21142 stop:23121 length:1980 start_codon:yes stop_codon:yes gene_type:complete
MKKIILFFLVCFLTNSIYAQTFQPSKKSDKSRIKSGRNNFMLNDSISGSGNSKTRKINLSAETKYTDYKIFSFYKDTSFVDTTLNIKKNYKFNFLRKDNFGLLPFHNIGQTFNRLTYDYDQIGSIPDIGFTAKQFSFKNVEDIGYYEVPTPTSEIMFLTTLEQGQFLESFFSLNFSKRKNVSISYTGLRSLGKYREALVSQGNFRTTFYYVTKKGHYKIRSHLSTQDILNEESGGLTNESLQAFKDNDPNFSDRARMDVNLNDTENFFKSSRFYFEHDFKILSSKDSVSKKDFTNLKIGHTFKSEQKSYEFRQNSNTDFLGTTNFSGNIRDDVKNSFLKNTFFLEFNSKHILGTFRVKSNVMSYSYGYKEVKNQNSGITKLKLEGNAASFGADWKAKVKNFKLDATGEITPGLGRLSGTNLRGNLSYKKDSLFNIKASILLNSKSPNFNFLLHQSSYNNYNWENNFENIRTQNIGFSLISKWLNTTINLTNIENFTYFGEDNKPKQFSENVTYLKVRISREFRYKRFAFDNRVMYQNVSGGSAVFRVPEMVTRNTLYYDDYWFKGKPMQVQIGATLNYFTKYKANAYNPLLAEFTIQNSEKIGFPTVDLFFNAQIRRTRVYFRIDNALSDLGNRNYFSAPNYPYRDFTIRFGLVWNWFI